MKLKNYYALLTAAAVCSVAFALFADSSSLLISLLRFPFGPIGNGLRIMSLAAEAENILAWMIFVMLSAIPAAIWLFMRKRSEAKCDILLLLLSPVLAVVLYNCINPFGSFLTAVAGPEMLQAQYGAVVYVILVSWLILRTVHAFRTAEESALYEASGFFLKLLGVLFVAVYVCSGKQKGSSYMVVARYGADADVERRLAALPGYRLKNKTLSAAGTELVAEVRLREKDRQAVEAMKDSEGIQEISLMASVGGSAL